MHTLWCRAARLRLVFGSTENNNKSNETQHGLWAVRHDKTLKLISCDLGRKSPDIHPYCVACVCVAR